MADPPDRPGGDPCDGRAVRALALDEVRPPEWAWVLGMEAKIGLALGRAWG